MIKEFQKKSNRKIVDHLSDINMVLTENARRYLIDENISPDRIFKTGSHLYEIIKYYEKKIDKSSIKEKLKIKKSEYFVVSAHREENVDNKKNLKDLIDSSIRNDESLIKFLYIHALKKELMLLEKLKSIN